MAKTTRLTERGTGETLYPETMAANVHTNDGSDVEARLESVKDDIDTLERGVGSSVSGTTFTQSPDGVDVTLTHNDETSSTEAFPMASEEMAGAVAAAQVKAWDAARLGAFVDLCRSYGATFDESTMLFSLNGLTDITEAQMRAIVAAGVMTNDNRNNLYFGKGIRTHLPPQIHLGVTTGNYTFRQSAVETVDAKYLVPGTDCFCLCSKLRRINVYSPNTANSVLYNTYKGCEALETLTVQAVYARSFWLGDSPRISLASLKGIISKAQDGSAASTITVHPDVYAKMTDPDKDDEWVRLPELAAPKNITFTTTK